MTMNQIQRAMYRAQAQPGQAAAALAHFQHQAQTFKLGLAPGDLMTISLFQWRAHFFAYWESIDEAVTPEALFGDMGELLANWPGSDQPRCFAPMMDIFHCLAPESIAHWRRKQPIERVGLRLARLKPEMGSSYIFYHYQLQEEQPGSFDKYGIISLHENLICFYQEHPAIVEEPRRTGKLTTTNTPPDWHTVMFPHFDLWHDAQPGQEIWRETELVLYQMAA